MTTQRVEIPKEAPFEVTLLEAASPSRIVIFAAGRGGDPERHAPLLDALHAQGNTVIAPHSDFFTNPRPTAEQLSERARRIQRAAEAFAPPNLTLHGIGHSIGATMLFAMAGAQAWLGVNTPLSVPSLRFETLTLLAPALGFFQAPGAADKVQAGTTIWWGSADTFCPRAEVDFTLAQLGTRGTLRVGQGAGHFSFMHTPPPNTPEPLAHRARFLEQFTAAVCADVASA